MGDYPDLNRQYGIGLVLIFFICLPLDFMFPLWGMLAAAVLIAAHLGVHLARCRHRKKEPEK